jgi:hypothetical protein
MWLLSSPVSRTRTIAQARTRHARLKGTYHPDGTPKGG